LNSDGEPYNKTRLLENVYASYFHNDFAVIEITNEQAPSEETLLIIGDSFTNSFERLFAEHYHTVYVIDPRYSESLDSFLVDHQIDDGQQYEGGDGNDEPPLFLEAYTNKLTEG
jgi:hypothetical protein